MSDLKQLSKLRQFRKGDDLDKYLGDALRQNWLAIEDAFRRVTKSTNSAALGANKLITAGTFDAFTVVTPTVDYLIPGFTTFYGTGLNDSGEYEVPEDGKYLFDFLFNDLDVNNSYMRLQVQVNSVSQYDKIVGGTAAGGAMTLSPQQSVLLDLVKNDRVSFIPYRSLGFAISVSTSVLKISKF